MSVKSFFLLFVVFVTICVTSAQAQREISLGELYEKPMEDYADLYVNGCKTPALPRIVLKNRQYITGLNIVPCFKWDTVNNERTKVILRSEFSEIPGWIYKLKGVRSLNLYYFDQIDWDRDLKKLYRMKQLEKLELYNWKGMTKKFMRRIVKLQQLKALNVYYPFPSRDHPDLKKLQEAFGERLSYYTLGE